jgi:hypothetical protein
MPPPQALTPHVLIATPAYGANVKLQYVESIMRTQQALQRRGIAHDFISTANAEVVTARNFLASVMVERPQYTHLLFVDADMAFAPSSVEALLSAEKPLIGCVYPKKHFNAAAFAAAVKRGEDNAAPAAAFRFVVRHPPGTTKVTVTNGMCRVLGLGMGLCLIGRSVFDGLLATGRIAQLSRHDLARDGLKGALLGFFDPLRGEGSQHLSEDFSFCERWVRWCNGEVWVLAGEIVSHVGDFVYSASYIDHLKATQ